MIFNNKLAMLALVGITGILACEKEAALPFYGAGKAPVLTASATTIAPIPADSSKTALTLTWTNPGYSIADSTVKYVAQLDIKGNNFAKPVSRTVTGALTTSWLAKEINTFMLNQGYQFGVAYDLQVRVLSSYANNNEQYSSNVIDIKATPYKVPPKVALPASGKLFIVGDATSGGWSNPVPVPTQELARMDETTWGGVFYLNGGGQYLILPLNTNNWDNKYSVANSNAAGIAAGGDFGANLPGNFPGPALDGYYKIMFDFQAGKFTVEPFTQQHGLPAQLVIVGNATPQDWNNTADNPYRFTRLNSAAFSLTVNLTAGGEYLILPEPTNWDKKFGAVNNVPDAARLAGTFRPEGSNFKAPLESGSYKIDVNFVDNSYKLTKQ